nr:penicillin-binding protein 1C [Solitalea agri]
MILLLCFLVWFSFFSLPSKLFNSPTSFVIEDANGELLGASIAADGQWRFPYNELVPDKFAKCITTFEDKRFYRHLGVDPLALGRAIKQNIKANKVVSGGSTLTMQVIRLSRKESRTFWQKFVEAILAFRLEFSYSKVEILALYASNAPYGTNVVGLDAAAWRYFGRSPEELSWGEMATLAVLPNSPSLVHPGKNRSLLRDKRNKLLDQLFDQQIIDKSTCDLAKLEPIPARPLPLPRFAPHLLSRFKNDFQGGKEKFTETRLRTTIQLDLQQKVTDILNRHHVNFKANGIENAAALVLDVETGNALAYVGNVINADEESQVDVIPAPRSPGSTLKPLLYASMLTEGDILPNTLIPDVPTQIAGYTPENYDLGYDGAVPASRALARSLNIPAVKMLQQYRFERFYDKLKQLGVSTLKKPSGHYGLSLILGGGENSMWELAGIYAGMARILNHQSRDNGKYAPEDIHSPSYSFINHSDGDNSGPLKDNGILDAGAIWSTFNAMEEVMRPGEELLWQQFISTQRIAWKTGTSFGFRDGWAIGLTPKYVVAVWVGNADGEGRPGLTGISAAAPVLFDVFRLLPTGAWFDPPYDKLRKLPICRLSGYKAGKYCEMIDSVWVPKTGINTKVCPFHQLVHLDRTGQFRVDANCESPELMQNKSWFVLPPAMEWYYKSKNQYYKPLPPFKANCEGAEQGFAMEIIYPKNGAKIYVPVELDESKGKTIFSAAHRNAEARIFWHLDDEFIETTQSFHQIALSPKPGKHKLTLVDENGERIEIGFEILQK